MYIFDISAYLLFSLVKPDYFVIDDTGGERALMWVLKAEYQTFTYFCILAAIIPTYPKANTLVCKNGDKAMERNNRKFKSTLKKCTFK